MADLITNTSAFLEPLDYTNRSIAEKAIIDALITSASEIFEKHCNRIFLTDTYTDELQDGNGWDTIHVNNPPLTVLTDIDIVHRAFDGTNTTTTYTGSKFNIHINSGEIRFKPGDFLTTSGGLFAQGFQNVQITYVGGFSSVPKPIQRLAAKYVIQSFDPTEDVQGLQKERLGDYFYDRGKDFLNALLFNDKKELDMYKIRRV